MKTSEQIFDDVVDLAPEHRRAALDSHSLDPDTRRDIESLLRAHDDAGQFFGEGTRAFSTPRDSFDVGSTLGAYELKELVGEGGFARVFRAYQSHPVRREVALKLLKLGMDSRAVITRFAQERQALAAMQHPNIAAFYDAGTTNTGRPYFVMELVDGQRITRYCEQRRFTIRQRIKLFIDVCHAVQHAHTKGLLHRDIKPSNILVCEVDQHPVPKMIDFGIAKALQPRSTDATVMTQSQQLLGTPQYMSPEQALSGGADVDTRSDIYSLGAVLYELLTGSPPLNVPSGSTSVLRELQRLTSDEELPRPSTRVNESLRRALRGDLDCVVGKCLEKDRSRRYESCAAVAADLQAYLEHRPISVAPPGRFYLARKFVRRNKLAVTAASVVLLTLVVGTIVSATLAIRAVRAERSTKAANENLRAVNDFLTEDMIGSSDPALTRGRPVTVRESLDNAAKTLATKFNDRPLTQAAVRHSVAAAYLKLGVVEPAVSHAHEALERRRALLGEDHPDTIKSLLLYAMALHAASRFSESEPLARDAMSRSIKVNGPDHPDTIEARQTRGVSLMRLDRAAEAESELQLAAQQCERVFGKDHKRTIETLSDRALALQELGRSADAEPLFRDVVERARRMGGEDHPVTVTVLSNHAFSLAALGRHDEALPLFQRAVELSRRVLGDDSPLTVSAITNCSKELLQLGRVRDAESLLVPSIQRLRANNNYGRRTIIAMDAYGRILIADKRFVELEALRQEVLQRSSALLGEQSDDTIGALNNYGVALNYLGRRAEALEVYQQVLEKRRKLLGDDHPRTLTSLNNVASSMRSLGRLQEAEPLSAELYRKAPNAQISPALMAIYMSNYGLCLARQSRFDEAEAPLIEAIRRFRETNESKDVHMVELLNSLADVYDHKNQSDRAAELRREAQALKPRAATGPTTTER